MKRAILVAVGMFLIGCGSSKKVVIPPGHTPDDDKDCICVYDGRSGNCIDKSNVDHPEADCTIFGK